jgi:hypothetical protein
MRKVWPPSFYPPFFVSLSLYFFFSYRCIHFALLGYVKSARNDESISAVFLYLTLTL